jgi:hypothetical protein
MGIAFSNEADWIKDTLLVQEQYLSIAKVIAMDKPQVGGLARSNVERLSSCPAPDWSLTVANGFCKLILSEDYHTSRFNSAWCNAAFDHLHKGGESHPYIHLQSDWRAVQ